MVLVRKIKMAGNYEFFKFVVRGPLFLVHVGTPDAEGE
jgi:hypothetical protein